MPGPRLSPFRQSFLRVLSAICCVFIAAAVMARETLDFNRAWRFTRSDPDGAQAPSFDDSGWSVVSTPHTFNDTDTFDNWSPPGHRGEGEQWSGRAWYRKTFAVPAPWRGKKVFIEFEAARQVAEVWLNGEKLGTAKSGFTPFGFDLTPHLKTDGSPNVLAVMTDNRFMVDPDPGAKLAPGQDRAGSLHDMLVRMERDMPARLEDLQAGQIPWNNPHWHPAHGGIYRNVFLHVTDPLHITLPLHSFLQTEGPYAYATEISAARARVGIDVPFRNDRASAQHAVVRVEIFDASRNKVLAAEAARDIAPGASGKVTLSSDIIRPLLWQPGYPHLYRVVCSLSVDGRTVDRTEVPLGIRTVRWDPQAGFFINGSHVKLHGWGQKPTDEWPGLGAAQPDRLHAYTLRLMLDAGGNFVRWGHAAAGPASIVAADRFGIVTLQPGVDGEMDTSGAAWELRSAAFRDVIIYFRNHPSILIWEGGNQKVSRGHAAELRAHMDNYDPHGGRVYAHRRADEITAAFMDIGIGTEGGREIARLPVVEGEYNREEAPRRVWDDFSPPTFGYAAVPGKVQTYRLNSEQFAVNQIAHYVKKLGSPAHAGGANWIFSDSTSGGRVETEVARASGEVDGARLPKEAWFVCAAMWRSDPQVHIIGHWAYPAGVKKTIHVASNADEVELLLNGKSLGRAKPEMRYLFTFPSVAFSPGSLTARAWRGGKEIAAHTLRTAGPAVALRMTSPLTGRPEKKTYDGLPAKSVLLSADGADVALVDVEAIDADGNRCPTWQGRVDFALEGPAVWRGGYNSGRPGSINHTHLDLEAGINRVALRATLEPGRGVLRARADGLRSAGIEFESMPPPSPVFAASPSVERFQPEAVLPVSAPDWQAVPALARPQPPLVRTASADEKMAGRFTKTFSYSAPGSQITHLDTDAQPGKNAYADTDSPFGELPAILRGADWIKACNSDALYNAVDLVELAVGTGAVVIIAHDDRLPRPPWLADQFEQTPDKIAVLGKPMTLFVRRMPDGGSLTAGANTEAGAPAQANMYVVFVAAAK
ncbi:DUF4982 domain-containing protein [Termitidicoccus mucosus]|uniref:Beta-galactosidase n=1 Tax=Termitidicoccus mucosus TaxID=1184151 RepID=A0A178IDG7_9BACT|nr:hypothetical protein AW736_24360 [Opitutaceae bacterium TSB47]